MSVLDRSVFALDRRGRPVAFQGRESFMPTGGIKFRTPTHADIDMAAIAIAYVIAWFRKAS